MPQESSRIQDLPSGEKPRERMQRLGAEALSNEELLAIFLRTGVVGESAIAIGARLLKRFGGLISLGRQEVKSLAKEHGIGLAKACQLCAAFELGARAAKESLTSLKLEEPLQVYEAMAAQMSHLRQESLRVILTDTKLQCIGVEEISLGTVNASLAHPRDILRPVLVQQAVGFFLVHNHPSGDPTPSSSDDVTTKKIKEAAELMQVSFHDHLIIGRPAPEREPYYSYRENCFFD